MKSIKKIFFLAFLLFFFSVKSQTKIPANGFYYELFPGTEQPRISCWYKNKLLDGARVVYQRPGLKESVYNYKNGRRNGTYSIFNSDGNITETGFYENDTLAGIKYMYNHGKISVQWTHLDKKNGLIKYKEYSAGKDSLKTEGFYRNNKKDSIWITYSNTGKKKSEILYRDAKDVGYTKTFYKNGNIKTYSEYEETTENGFYYTFSDKGDTLSKVSMIRGKKDGPFFTIEKKNLNLPYGEESIPLRIRGHYVQDKKEGRFFYHYTNGKLAIIEDYKNGLLDGLRTVFDSLGNHVWDYPFRNGNLDGKLKEWYISGKIKREEVYKNAQFVSAREYFESGVLKMETKKTDPQHEQTTSYFANGKPQLQEIFKNGVKIESITYDTKGRAKKQTFKYVEPVPIFETSEELQEPPQAEEEVRPEDEIFTFVDEMPEFPGGAAEMLKFLAKNIKYPDSAKEAGISGKCYLKFVVDEEGEVSNVQVMKGVRGCSECDKEAIRAVKMFPAFKPGKMNGKPVKVYFMLPINFKMQ